jgi:hypothetical protein
MTGGTTVDMAVVHVESHETFDKFHSDKIAEAEALAAEALRMANEAKRAAERLAEVKKTLAMFSKKLDRVEKVVVVQKASKLEDDEATPFEADKAAVVAKKAEDAPVKEEKKPVEEPTEKELPPPVEEEEEEFVPPPPPAVVERAAPAPIAVIEVEEEEKDVFEAALDQLGVDKMCGVDDEALAKAHAKELGIKAPVVVKKAAPAPKKVAPVVARVTAPKAETRIIALTDDDGKDFFEKTLDSWGVDRLCGVDDVTLGFADSYPDVPPPPTPEPFENPTRIEYKEIAPLEIVHSESLKEQKSKEIREQLHMPRKIYQRAPTNYEFADPFGVDHDDFVMCGRLADLCEPDFESLQQPEVYALPAPVPRGEPEKSILKKEPVPEAPKQESAAPELAKKVIFQEASEEVSLRGAEPDGAKNSFDSSNADNEPYSSTVTHGHLRSAPASASTEQRPVSVVLKVPSSPVVRPKPIPEVVVEEREEEQVYHRQQQVVLQKKDLLQAMDNHLWCV